MCLFLGCCSHCSTTGSHPIRATTSLSSATTTTTTTTTATTDPTTAVAIDANNAATASNNTVCAINHTSTPCRNNRCWNDSLAATIVATATAAHGHISDESHSDSVGQSVTWTGVTERQPSAKRRHATTHGDPYYCQWQQQHPSTTQQQYGVAATAGALSCTSQSDRVASASDYSQTRAGVQSSAAATALQGFQRRAKSTTTAAARASSVGEPCPRPSTCPRPSPRPRARPHPAPILRPSPRTPNGEPAGVRALHAAPRGPVLPRLLHTGNTGHFRCATGNTDHFRSNL